MMKRVHSIAIIESSQIIREGISKLILDSTSSFYPVNKYENIENFISASQVADIIIINPNLYVSNNQLFKDVLSIAPGSKIISLISCCLPDSLNDKWDESISIYSTQKEIIEKLRGLVEKPVGTLKQVEIVSDQYDLSERELEVLISVAKGLTNKEIATNHNISVHTVMSHRKNIIKKTGIKSISGLTVYALINGFIDK